jgi:ribosomal protein L24
MSAGDRVLVNVGLYSGLTGEVIVVYNNQSAALVSLDSKHVMVRLDLSWLEILEEEDV